MPAETLTIDLMAPLPARLRDDKERLRYLIAGALYSHGEISGEEARKMTGDIRYTFEKKMAVYGFPIFLGTDEELETELNA